MQPPRPALLLLCLLLCTLRAARAQEQAGDVQRLAAARKAQVALADEKRLDDAKMLLPGFDPGALAEWRKAVIERIAVLERLTAKLPGLPVAKGPETLTLSRTLDGSRKVLVNKHNGLAAILAEQRKLPPRKQLEEERDALRAQQKARPRPGSGPLADYRKATHELSARWVAQRLEWIEQKALPRHAAFESKIALHRQQFASARKHFLEMSQADHRQFGLPELQQRIAGLPQKEPDKLLQEPLLRYRTALQKLLATRQAFAALPGRKEIEAQLKAVENEQRQLAPSALPARVTETTPYEQQRSAAEQAVKAARQGAAAVEQRIAATQRQLESLPGELEQARKTLEQAGVAQTGKQAALQLEARLIERMLAEERLAFLQQQQRADLQRKKLAEAELALAEKKLLQAEQLLTAARKRIEEQRKPRLDELDRRARQAQRAAAQETEPFARFQTEIAAEIAAGQRDKLAEETMLQQTGAELELARDELEQLAEELAKLELQLDRKRRGTISQETVAYLGRRLLQLRRLRATKTELRRRVRERLDRKQTAASMTAGRIAELRRTGQQLDEGRESPGSEEELLQEYGERFRRLIAAIPSARRPAAAALLELLRPVLAGRQALLKQLVASLERLEQHYSQQLERIEALHRLIASRIYWMRTDEPLGLETVARLPHDLRELRESYTSPELRQALDRRRQAAGRRIGLCLAGIALLLLAGAGAWFFPIGPPRWSYRGGLVLAALQQLALIGARSAPATLCFLGAAGLLQLAALPPALHGPALALCLGLAGVLFTRRFLGIFLRDEGLAERQLGVSEEVRAELERAVGRLTWLGLSLWLPWYVLSRATPPPPAISRLLYSALLLAGALLLVRLLRVRGPLIEALTGGEGLWRKAWSLAYPPGALAVLGIVGMDLLGYRIGAWVFTQTVLQLLVAVAALAYVHRLCTRLVARAAYAILSRAEPPPPEEGSDEPTAVTRYRLFKSVVPQVSRLTGTAVLVAGVLLTAWGLDLFSSVRVFCEGVEFYRSGEGVLHLWHLLKAAAWIAGGHFLLHHLPGIYELVLFPRLPDADAAVRYVILTLSRYAVLVVAYGMALLNLQVNLSSLGWLMAALSVGIGFGLQEIIANFVSGLILLLERPIRVGDIIKVGDELGRVRKINIRATIVDNFDRLAIIVPNRKLITDNVINWTYSDPIRRQIIPVGVAYGSDVARVFAILRELVTAHPQVLQNPEPPQVFFLGFGESSLDFKIYFHTLIADGFSALSALHEQIHRRFAEEGIEIPFPQRDLHLVSIPEGVTPPRS